jgi:hypothetical protein
MSDSTLKVTDAGTDPKRVKLSIDRPGLAAMSYVDDPVNLIHQIAEAAGLDVLVDEPVEDEPLPPPVVEDEPEQPEGEPAPEPEPQPEGEPPEASEETTQ